MILCPFSKTSLGEASGGWSLTESPSCLRCVKCKQMVYYQCKNCFFVSKTLLHVIYGRLKTVALLTRYYIPKLCFSCDSYTRIPDFKTLKFDSGESIEFSHNTQRWQCCHFCVASYKEWSINLCEKFVVSSGI